MKKIYTHPDCEYSEMLLEELDSKGIKYYKINLIIDPECWNDVEKICKGRRMTPIIINSDGTSNIGYQGIASKF